MSTTPAGAIAPSVFISYSWACEDWVIELAERLMTNGVYVVLDKWDLKEGHDLYAFMEKMVTDPNIKRVLIILDKTYQEKADARTSGVGSESQIISGELYGKTDQQKFIPIIRERSPEGKAYQPVYLKSRVYIDLSSDDTFADAYDQLLRNIFEKPARQRPALGTPPAFLNEPNPASPATRFSLDKYVKAAEAGTPNARGHFARFLSDCVTALAQFPIALSNGLYDELVFSRIQEMKPLRNEVLKAVECMLEFTPDPVFVERFHQFLEEASHFQEHRQEPTWNDRMYDQYKFWLRELFISVIALVLKRRKWAIFNLLTEEAYTGIASTGEPNINGFNLFHGSLGSFYDRNQRLKLGRISIFADHMKERCDFPGLTFEDLMQGDFTLTLKSVIAMPGEFNMKSWFPELMVFREHAYAPFPLYANLQTSRGFEAIKTMFHVDTPAEFLAAMVKNKQVLGSMTINYWPIAFGVLAGVDRLPKQP